MFMISGMILLFHFIKVCLKMSVSLQMSASDE